MAGRERETQKELLNQPEFGWHYYHFLCEDGTRLNVILHETDIFGLDKTPKVSMTVMSKGAKALYKSVELDKDILHQNTDQIASGNSEATFNFPLGEVGGFYGKLNRLAPPFAPNEGILHNNESNGKTNNWEISIPHGSFEGVLRQGDVNYELKGTVYVDRQWGDEKIQEFVAEWVWGHFSNKEHSVLFYQVNTKTGETLSGQLTVENGEVAFENCKPVPKLESMTSKDYPEEETVEIDLTVGAGVPLVFSLNSDRIMRLRKDEEHHDFKATYIRWGTEASLNGMTLPGIVEYMKINPKESMQTRKQIVLLAGLSGSGKTTVAKMMARNNLYVPILTQELYRRIAKSKGYDSAREWLKKAGNEEFMETTLLEIVEEIKNTKQHRFVVDGVSGLEMIQKLKERLPEYALKIVSLESDQAVRERRISNRQSLTLKEAQVERGFRDGFLTHFGVEEAMKEAGYKISSFSDNGKELREQVETLMGLLSDM